jgi:hypothetical protein
VLWPRIEKDIGCTNLSVPRKEQGTKLHHIVGTPPVENFKLFLLHVNVIKNCPVTVEDAKIAEKTFGPGVSSLKELKSKPVRKDLIEIPKERITKHHWIELCMDAMCPNECGMLILFDRTIKHRSLVPMQTKHQEECFRALNEILRQCNNARFVMTATHCNGEHCSRPK